MVDITLEDIYTKIENNESFNFANVNKDLRSMLNTATSEDILKKVKCEINCMDFQIENGEPQGIFGMTDAKGELKYFPSLDNFDDNDYQYLRERINYSKNNFIILVYSCILWAGKREIKYGECFIDTSLELINEHDFEDFHETYEIINVIKNCFINARKTKHNCETVKEIIINWIENEDFWNLEFSFIPFHLIDFVLSQKNNFKTFFKNLDKICWDIYKNIEDSNNFQLSLSFLELCEKCSNKLKNTQFSWRLEMAKCYELKCKSDKNPLVQSHFCMLAINSYKKAKKFSKADELLNFHKTEISPNMVLKKISIPLDELNEIYPLLLEATENIMEKDINEIFAYLIASEEILPDYQRCKELSENISNDFPLLHDFSKVNINDEKLPIGNFENEEDKINSEIMFHYSNEMTLVFIPFIIGIFDKAFNSGKLTRESCLNFIKDKTWFGVKKVPGWDIENHFFELIVPGINYYFLERNLYLLYPNYHPHFVLTIDSLTLKLEGIIKLLCNIFGIEIKETTDKNVVQDKSLNKLLDDEKLAEKLGQNNIFFLKYLLIDKCGLNIRNEAAHSLLALNEYNYINATLLLVALLRLCKYNWTIITD